MAKQKTASRRPIDENVTSASKRLKSKFVLVPSMEIKAWKAFVIIVFAAGFAAALVWSAYNQWYVGSSAKTAHLVTPVKKNTPVILSSTPNGDLASGTTSTLISVHTKEKANCRYGNDSGKAIKYLNLKKFTKTGGTVHSLVKTKLTDGSSYSYVVLCRDKSSDRQNAPYKISFSVKKKSDPGKQCISAGNAFLVGTNGKSDSCCQGLTALDNGSSYDSQAGICQNSAGAGLVCSNCGNGTCEPWENHCNCAADCAATAPQTMTIDGLKSFCGLPRSCSAAKSCEGKTVTLTGFLVWSRLDYSWRTQHGADTGKFELYPGAVDATNDTNFQQIFLAGSLAQSSQDTFQKLYNKAKQTSSNNTEVSIKINISENMCATMGSCQACPQYRILSVDDFSFLGPGPNIIQPPATKDISCQQSGGTVSTFYYNGSCKDTGDFAASCKSSHRVSSPCGNAKTYPGPYRDEKVCSCGTGKCFDGNVCVAGN